MGFEFQYPHITGATEREQILQLKNYLFQFVDQLQYVIGNFDSSVSGGSSPATVTVASSNAVNPNARTMDFSDIKALIIKSADIVNAYYEKIKKRLDGVYVAESEFGTFKEQTSQDIENSSTMIERSFSNYQTISNEVASVGSDLRGVKDEVDGALESLKGELQNLNYSLVAVTANIKSGLLYYDGNGIPVYGLEVGQRTMIDGVEVFDKFARFTSDRLSFYDNNDNEVAYISDRKLYINNVEIKSTLKMGGFVRTVLADGSIVKRWIEGGEG